MTWTWHFILGTSVWFVISVSTQAVTAVLRVLRKIICRTEAQLDLLGSAAGMAAYGWVMSWVDGSLTFALVMLLGTGGFVVGATFRQGLGGRVRQHWSHDEDCKFGPRRRREALGKRLVGWAKVALRPEFQPT